MKKENNAFVDLHHLALFDGDYNIEGIIPIKNFDEDNVIVIEGALVLSKYKNLFFALGEIEYNTKTNEFDWAYSRPFQVSFNV